MGYVGERYTFRDGCGIYNASVPVIDPDVVVIDGQQQQQQQGGIATDLFWTSAFRHYSNHLKDVIDAHTIKTENLGPNESAALFTEERLEYLKRHLDQLHGFPKHFSVQLTSNDDQNNAATQQSAQLATATTPAATTNIGTGSLPDCGTIPIKDWEPVGIFDAPLDDPSPRDPDEGPRWPFRSARCYFPVPTLEEMNDLYAGIRIRQLGDR